MQCTSLGVGVGGDGDVAVRLTSSKPTEIIHMALLESDSHTHEAGRGRQARRELAGGNRHGHAAVGKIYRKVKCRITAKRAWPICRPACQVHAGRKASCGKPSLSRQPANAKFHQTGES